MLKKDIFVAPILNNKKELIIFYLNNSKQTQSNTDVFILAGGLGKRMTINNLQSKTNVIVGSETTLSVNLLI